MGRRARKGHNMEVELKPWEIRCPACGKALDPSAICYDMQCLYCGSSVEMDEDEE